MRQCFWIKDLLVIYPTMPLFLLVFMIREVSPQCSFPEFLLEGAENGQKVWNSKAKYVSNSGELDSIQHIIMEETMYTAREIAPTDCLDYEGDGPGKCRKEEVIYKRYCREALDDLKFKVQHGQPGYEYEQYLCIQFIPRGPNIVQIYRGKLYDKMKKDMCNDNKIGRDEWPWLGERQDEWVPCPLIGGFDFSAFPNERKKKLCHRVWRPSRLESECIMGDGMNLLFPEKSCSPFKNRALEEDLKCWGDWIEDNYHYIVLAPRKSKRSAEYILRLPSNHEQLEKMTALFYFSPVAPAVNGGMPPGNILHIGLKMSRSESGVCYDESGKVCEKYAREGKCTDGGLHQFANHCKRSCGLCKLAPSRSAECHFPPAYQGEWLLFERDRREEVTISGGHIVFSHLGTFICKSKHWEHNQYKLLSVYQDGCRPRFTCIHFIYQENGSILRYRLSYSSRTDRSFDVCEFENDVPPLGGQIRSDAFKVLFPVSRTHLDSCGLGGLVKVNAIFADGRSCVATLSDWNPFTCSRSPRMNLAFRECKHDIVVEHQEFQCEAYVDMQHNYRLLVTRQDFDDTEQYACWVITVDPNSVSTHPWTAAYILKRAQCGAPEDLDPIIFKPAAISYQIFRQALEKDCIEMNKTTTHASTIRYYVRKGGIKGSVNGSNHRNGRTKPITTPARSASAQSSGAAGFPTSQTIVILTLCTLQYLVKVLVPNSSCCL